MCPIVFVVGGPKEVHGEPCKQLQFYGDGDLVVLGCDNERVVVLWEEFGFELAVLHFVPKWIAVAVDLVGVDSKVNRAQTGKKRRDGHGLSDHATQL